MPMIEWIVSASALILMVLLLRVIVKGRVNPRLRYALWGLVLLRLVIPVSLWESPASVLHAAQSNEGYQLASTLPTQMELYENGTVQSTAGSKDSFQLGPEVFRGEETPSLHNAYGWVAVPGAEQAQALRDQGQKAVDTAGLKRMVDVQRVLLAVWQGGVWLSMLFLAAVNGKFALGLRRNRRPDGTYRGRPVYVADGLATPCLFGLFNPGIYLTPDVAEDGTAREHVLAHEYAHFRQGDHAWAVCRGVCLAIHWYNPLVWLAAHLSRRDCELSCDEGAVRLLGEDRRADYGRTLVGLAARRATPKDMACCATTMTGGKSALKERIALLVKRPRTTVWMACIVAAACIVFAVCTFTGAAAETEQVSEPDTAVDIPSGEEHTADGDEILEGIVSELVRDFQENHQVSDLWIDPDMGESPGPSYLSVSWRGTEAVVEVNSWALKTGGGVACSLDKERYGYDGLDGPEGGTLTIYGEARYTGSPVEGSVPLRYVCPVAAQADGSLAAGAGLLLCDPPTDLPAEPMDLDRPAEEQGPWLLLAQTPGFDIALYRSAWDDQHVYLRVTNQSFQQFDRDLSAMELLPVLEVVDGGADLTARALYRRYEGTYFNGTSYEPGIVAEQVFYDWNEAGRYWSEWTVTTQPAQRLTEDLPALVDLPDRLVRPGTPEAEADMWLIGELPAYGIAVYHEQSAGKVWLRYNDAIQEVKGVEVCLPQMILPELYWDDLDGDGNRELAAISTIDHGTGVSVQELTVYEWDGQRWTWTTHDEPSQIIKDFNRQRDYAFYEDGTAYIRYNYLDLLLDLSLLWESDYWGGAAPDICELSPYQINYTYEDGQLVLTLVGELLHDGSPFLRGYAFECVWHVLYYSGSLTGYRGTLTAGRIDELRSDFAIEPKPPELTDTWRAVLAKIWDECEKKGENVFAVHDVNGDGEDELIVRWTLEGSPNYGWGTTVYNTNGKAQFYGGGQLTFYSNGAISVPWSHNQGPAAAIWPYDLYTCRSYVYNGTNVSTYTEVGSARARSDIAPDFEEVAYADLDGDGMVYYIGEDAYTEEHPVDNVVYEAWRDRYLAGAQVLPVLYFDLTEDVISP